MVEPRPTLRIMAFILFLGLAKTLLAMRKPALVKTEPTTMLPKLFANRVEIISMGEPNAVEPLAYEEAATPEAGPAPI